MRHHCFDPTVAALVGVNAAVIFAHLSFWITLNEQAGRNKRDGTYWTYHSKKDLGEHFFYMGTKAIDSAVGRLIDAGLIKTGCYNQSPFDRTTWYALTDRGKSMVPKIVSPLAHYGEMENPKEALAIPDNTPISTHTEDARFEEFWSLYPKKKSKEAAKAAWENLAVSDQLYAAIIQAVTLQSQSDQWTKDRGRYIPYPARWLCEHRWEDEVDSPAHDAPVILYKDLTFRR